MTAPTHSHNVYNGHFLDTSFFCVSGAIVVSMHAKINNSVNVLVV